MPTQRIEDGDVFAIRAAAQAAVGRIRAGGGPELLECLTYRWREHVGPNEDFDQNYRSASEREPWLLRDQIPRLAAMLPVAMRTRIAAEIEASIADAVRFAEESPFPQAASCMPTSMHPDSCGPCAMWTPCAKPWRRRWSAISPSSSWVWMSTITRRFRVPRADCLHSSGRERVFTTPLSEDAMTGVAIGAAMAGMRPIHVHIRMDFLLLCMNQLINIAAKAHYMYDGSVSVPLVVRSMIGKSWGQGAQHSQGLHSLFAHVPGLKVVLPSNAHDAKGLMISAIRDNNPVIFVEHRLLYGLEAYVPEEPFTVPFGKARITRPGSDITIVGISNMQVEALRAHELLNEIGIEAEVIDPITLVPLGHRRDRGLGPTHGQSAGRRQCLDELWRKRRDRCPGGRVSPWHGIRVKRLGFAPTTCPTTPTLEAAVLSQSRNDRRCRPLHAAPERDAMEPDPERCRMAHNVNFKGPF